jgi:DNA-binding MarR family transcriptional regulator
MQPAPLPPVELGPALAEVFRVVGPLYRHAARAVAEDEAMEQVSTGVRAVLEHLLVAGAEPVPAVARAIATSRQFVQRMVNEAADQGLVELVDNPAHRRSRLVALTPPGRKVIERITHREQLVLGATAGGLTGTDIDTCVRVLRCMLEQVRARTGNLD